MGGVSSMPVVRRTHPNVTIRRRPCFAKWMAPLWALALPLGPRLCFLVAMLAPRALRGAFARQLRVQVSYAL